MVELSRINRLRVYVCVYTCMYIGVCKNVLCLRIHTAVDTGKSARNPSYTSKASGKSCKCTKEWVKNPATATSLRSPGEKKRGFSRESPGEP